MAYSNTAKHVSLDAVGAAASWISAHSADPGKDGANEITGVPRKQTTWGGAANAENVGSQVALDIPGGETVTHLGVWSLETAGEFYCGDDASNQETFGGDGVLNVVYTLTSPDPA